MPTAPGSSLNTFLRWSERYTHTDMVYLAESGFWITLGSVCVSLFSLALYIVFARMLSPEVYGTYQYLLSAGALIGAFSLTGMNSAVIRAVAQGREGVLRPAVRTQLWWGILPFAISLAVALYYLTHGNTLLAVGFALTAIFMPINNALNTYSAFLGGKKDFKRLFFYNTFINIVFYGTLISLAFTGPGALMLIAVNLITQLIGLSVAYRAVIRKNNLPNEVDKDTLQYGKHLSLMGVASSVVQYADNILAFHFLGPALLAVYAFATAVPDRIGGLLKFIPSALLPSLSQKEPGAVREAITSRSVALIACTALVVAGLYALAAPLIFHFLFPRYEISASYSQIYAFYMILIVANVFITALTAQKDIFALYVVNTAFPFFQFILQMLGIIFFGLWGLVGARITASVLLSILSGLLLFREKKVV